MLLNNRHGSVDSDAYRYGFQGQERDDEVKGEGNSYNYKYRMHDPRVGRFFAVDPLKRKYPHYSHYSFSGNKVIAHRELEGLEESWSMLGNTEYIEQGLGEGIHSDEAPLPRRAHLQCVRFNIVFVMRMNYIEKSYSNVRAPRCH